MTPFQTFFQDVGPYLWLITFLVLIGVIFWLYRLQMRYTRNYRQLDQLLRNSSGGDNGLEELLTRLTRLERSASQMELLQTAIRELELRQNRSFQSVGLVRFNPFSDMGGDQSFALSIVDSFGDGFVLSSLHGRTATRVYAKTVRRGRSTQTISTEEQAAIDQAMRYQQLPPDTGVTS
ncbi:MAG TPA: DUF4446 family protein [Chloroflexia bacterium]|nr:DUF4446 family protein [Chloroflexia bacterium]